MAVSLLLGFVASGSLTPQFKEGADIGAVFINTDHDASSSDQSQSDLPLISFEDDTQFDVDKLFALLDSEEEPQTFSSLSDGNRQSAFGPLPQSLQPPQPQPPPTIPSLVFSHSTSHANLGNIATHREVVPTIFKSSYDPWIPRTVVEQSVRDNRSSNSDKEVSADETTESAVSLDIRRPKKQGHQGGLNSTFSRAKRRAVFTGTQCKHCSKNFKTSAGLWKHMVGKHLDIPQVAARTRTQKGGSAKCGYCSRLYMSQYRCQEHIRNKHAGCDKLNFTIGDWAVGDGRSSRHNPKTMTPMQSRHTQLQTFYNKSGQGGSAGFTLFPTSPRTASITASIASSVPSSSSPLRDANASRVSNHRRSLAQEWQFKCRYCDCTLVSAHYRRKHELEVHEKVPKERKKEVKRRGAHANSRRK